MERTFFEMRREAQGFDQSLAEIIRSVRRGGVEDMVSEQNVQRFTHGRRWNHRSNPHTVDGEMQTLSAEGSTPFAGIVEGDLTLIPRMINSIAAQMTAAQMRMLYDTLSKSCDENGQTVSAAELGNAAAFLAMLRKIEFGVDRDGNVSMPQIHAAPGTAKAMMAELEAQPPEFQAEVEWIKAEKSKEALERERLRLSRFRSKD